jgi:hypothetical protein
MVLQDDLACRLFLHFFYSKMEMNKSMAKYGVTFKPRVKLIKLCKAEYAKSVLTTDRYILYDALYYGNMGS